MPESNLILKTQTLLGYQLTLQQEALLHYVTPTISLSVIYIFIISCDCGVIFRHYKDDNPVWAAVTIAILYFPALISFIITISSPELWPNIYGMGRENFVWFLMKTMEHLLFPVWAMWDFAGKLFWALEAFLNYNDETIVSRAFEYFYTPRTFELYFFLQSFLHSLPQILLQVSIIFRRELDMAKATADIQIASCVLNLAKLSATIAFYQRFKSQKVAGRQYPWLKPEKQYVRPEIEGHDEVDHDEPDAAPLEPPQEPEEPQIPDSRRSSDFYLEPAGPSNLKPLKEVLGTLRETSIIDGPNRTVYREAPELDSIRRVVRIKSLPEDDLAGKIVSFFWWYCFLLARILAVSAFAYFYPKATIWTLISHFVIVIAFLIYDAKTDEMRQAKGIFFAFLGIIFIFCIVEFKIRFKKTKFMYAGFFTLVFVENFVMCLIWWIKNVEDLENDFWFRYVFYVILLCSIISVTAMALYFSVNKPSKIIVKEILVRPNL